MATATEPIQPGTPVTVNSNTRQASFSRKEDNNGGSRPPSSDPVIYRMVVVLLGLVMVTGIGGALVLALHGKDKPPDILLALGSAAVGALAGILAPSPDKR